MNSQTVGAMLFSGAFTPPHQPIFTASLLLFVAVLAIFVISAHRRSKRISPGLLPYVRFFYASFVKPHRASSDNGQQSALESFYKAQATVYDATRKVLLKGREDMLGLLVAQMQLRFRQRTSATTKPVWVDIGAGTGWNAEQMDVILSVGDFFEHVYLVDFSPSLCEVARKRVQRQGWKNVSVVCQDARSFRPKHGQADLITMSYSLSMIPDYYSVVDSLTHLLAPKGVIGVCDFYVQSIVDIYQRSYTGGSLNRHVNWLGRLFWRAWFDADRVNLDGGRRDFLEWSFGTIISSNDRNYTLGGIPYYIFVGCSKSLEESPEKLDAVLTESPYLSPKEHQKEMMSKAQDTTALRSKAYESAVINLAANLPLPSAFYQNHHWRIYYNDLLQKHQQFNGEYIYAFNWEDPQTDRRLLNVKSDDVILAITSAGDNILDLLLENPRRIHAVDLNPNQGHLLELKVAAFTALSHADVWRLFGDGRHDAFRNLVIQKLSSHMSSHATQYWLNHAFVFDASGRGLYESGGSGLAIRLVRRLLRFFGLSAKVQTMCSVETLNEQRELWPQVRRILMSWLLHRAVVSTSWWAWKAGGVPPAQRQMIVNDYAVVKGVNPKASGVCGEAMWQYLCDTFDPVIRDTLLSRDNYFYHLCLQGRYSRKCHPRYLGPRQHAKLSKPSAFDGLRVHTDELMEVITRLAPNSLTIAILMDSMDWFDQSPPATAAKEQVAALRRVLKARGRILLRSAALRPWYVALFEESGFKGEPVGPRRGGACVDRVNMYASTWILTKMGEAGEKVERRLARSNTLEDLSIGDAALK